LEESTFIENENEEKNGNDFLNLKGNKQDGEM
jgi:hypothetical protein